MEERPPTGVAADKAGMAWVWDGVRASVEENARLQPKWDIPDYVVIKADVGHTHRAAQVVKEAVAAVRAGACAVHLHIVDENGRDTGDIKAWRQVVEGIRAEVGDVLIDSGPRGATFDEQMALVRSGLFDIIPISPNRDPRYVGPFLHGLEANGVKTEIIVWDTTDILLAKTAYIESGLIQTPIPWLLVPNSLYRGMPMPDPMFMAKGLVHMVELVRSVDPKGPIFVSACGRSSNYLAAMGLLLGLHVRPGVGETHWRYPHKDEVLTSNTLAIGEVATIARTLGRNPTTAEEYRRLLSR